VELTERVLNPQPCIVAVYSAVFVQNAAFFMPVEDLGTGVTMKVAMATVTEMTHQCLHLNLRLIYDAS
jgi:hypothetical protein